MGRGAVDWGMLLFLLACSDKGGDTATEPSCDAGADTPYTFPSGTWEMSLDEVGGNECENAAGNGLHLDLGEITVVDFSQGEGDCLTGDEVAASADDPAMAWEGTTSGSDAFSLSGFVEVVMGTCVWGVEAEMEGTVVSDSELAYRIDATLVVVREGGYVEEGGEWQDIEGACDLIVGDEEHHTFPALPCEASWSGTGSPQ